MNGGPNGGPAPGGRAQQFPWLLVAVAGVAVLPLVVRGISCGQDFDFHLQNWLELAQAWHHGVLYPWWSAAANYGAGEPRYVFYPPLSRVLGAALGCVLPWAWTPAAFCFACLLGAGFSLRAMAREWLPEASATVAACLYVVNPYMMFLIYERGALAELLAATWIPLLALFALRKAPSAIPLALAYAALWLTNAPSGVMGSYMLAILVLVAAFRRGNGGLVARAVCAAPLGLALAGFWLIPAMEEQRWVEIARATAPLMRVEDSFLFGFVSLAGVAPDERFDTVYHNHVLWLASWVAVALIVLVVLGAVFSRKRRGREGGGWPWLPLSVLGAVLIVLQFRFSAGVWRVTPELHYLQFPWRWMLVLGMIFAFFAGGALASEGSRRALVVRGLAVLLLATGMASLASGLYWQACDEEDNVNAQIVTLHQGGFAGTDEYTPQPADNSLIQQDLPAVRVLDAPDAETAETGDNPEWSADPQAAAPAQIAMEGSGVEHWAAAITTARPAWAVFRLMDYPAWQITRNGSPIESARRADGLVAIPLEAGRNQIEIRWRLTGDQWWGMFLSLAGLAVTLGVVLATRRKARKVPIP